MIIWKSDLTDKMKLSFFQAAVTSILIYGCTTWTITKRLEKKLDGNYTRMLRAILNKSLFCFVLFCFVLKQIYLLVSVGGIKQTQTFGRKQTEVDGSVCG